ncbi:hypothetical protein BGZ65_002567 [Modicella reniformis]|uniref:Uncharacterized protein n=1 Tax=Modicella reniformis TaxID=1440133 RepID=A0A9P6IL26_9FUNG|nr:hypothetical protein BGZ65_002567 [Modicella reniformis]
MPEFPATQEPTQQIAKHDDQFLELAGILGEGQAVKNVFGTHKAMIRQLKRELRALAKKNKKLEKRYEKQTRELERAKKANERHSQFKNVRPHHNGGETRIGHTGSSSQQAAAVKAEQEQRAVQQQGIEANNKQSAELKRMLEEIKNQIGESDPLFLLDSDSTDDDENDDDDEESGSESESEESDHQGDQHNAEEGPSTTAIHRSRDDEENTAQGRSQRSPSATRRSPSTKPCSSSKISLNSSSKARDRQTSKGVTKDQKEEDLHISKRDPTHGTSTHSVSPSQEVHRIMEKMGELHIHNHIHYGNDDLRASLHRVENSSGTPQDVHSSSTGSGIKSSERGGGGLAIHDPLNTQPSSSSSRGVLHQSLPSDQRPGSRTENGPTEDMDDDSDSYQPFRIRAPRVSSGRNAKFGDSPLQELPTAITSRILAMRKRHDPKKCIVCRSNNDDGASLDQQHPWELPSVRGKSAATVRFGQSKSGTPAAETQMGRSHNVTSLTGARSADADAAELSDPSISASDETESSESHLVDNRRTRNRNRSNDPSNYKRSMKQLSSTRQKSRRLEDDDDHLQQREGNLTPEQRLHRVIGELKEEVQQYRRSYLELSKDPKTLRSSLPVPGTNGNVGGGGGGSSRRKGKRKSKDDHLVPSTPPTDRNGAWLEGSKERQRQMMTLEQLQVSADGLAERVEEAMRLHDHYLQERHKQDNEKRKGKNVSTSGHNSEFRESRPKDGSIKYDHRKGKQEASFSDASDNEAKDTHMKRDTGTSEQMEDQKADIRTNRDSAINIARPKDRLHRERRPSPQGGDGGNHDRNEDMYDGDERRRAEGDRGHHRKHLEGATADREQGRRKLKEPEGYRHRVTSEIRVPKLH